MYNGDLVVGGRFNKVNGLSANSVARWNGAMWQGLGSGINGNFNIAEVSSLTIYNGDLIAGGYFTIAGGASADAIARWDGAAWQPLGIGLRGGDPPEVASLVIYNNELIAGGWFTTAGGQSAFNIARWRDCDMCLADITNDDQVNTDDLLNVIGAWGPCPPQPQHCPAEVAPLGGDDVVNITDLLAVIQGWGNCCWGDATFNGHVNIDDLLAVLNAWGACPPEPPPVPYCPADITHSGAVNIDDLLMVIAAWGPCS